MAHRSRAARFAARHHDQRQVHKRHKDSWKRRRKEFNRSNVMESFRVECHRVFDRLWCGTDAIMSRSVAYKWLIEVTGLSEDDAHIGLFSVVECRRVVLRVYLDFPRLFDLKEICRAVAEEIMKSGAA